MSDVVDTHRSGAMSKLGFASSAKYAVTSFINEKIWSGVQPKIETRLFAPWSGHTP